VLILDNRGMGGSSKPLMRYSTSEMARDLLEVLDHVGWTAPRSVHVCGISMGGMIAQELACLAPERVASLGLICTAAFIENTTGFVENMVNRITMLLPKSLDRSVAYAADRIFAADWLDAPDDAELPDDRTPGVVLPPGGYGRFATNYERFAAQEVTKQRDVVGFTKAGFLMQLIAAGWHHKSPAQLAAMADALGRDRILVVHGTADNMISPPHGRKLIDYLQPGAGLMVDGMGHAPVMERTAWLHALLDERMAIAERLDK
jgi:pimeloyl-ACP methyl ester carboxylesterase